TVIRGSTRSRYFTTSIQAAILMNIYGTAVTLGGNIPIQGAWRDITYSPVRDKIWSVSEGIYRSIFLKGRKGVVAFDTLTTPGTARAYASSVGRVFPNDPIHTIVYSHDHLDHTGYAEDMAPEAHIIAHELCDKVIRRRQSDGQLAATETFVEERKDFSIDGVEFELIYPGPTHGDGNIAAYFPQSKLLFMVDTVIPGVGYTFFPDWHLVPYVPVMKRLLSLDWDLFVPGHFWITDRQGFIDNLAYYDRMADMAQQAIFDSIDPHNFTEVKKYTKANLRGEFGELFRFQEYCAMNLSRYMQHYLTGGWGIEGNWQPDTTPL
ncbi:MAG: MBL fold metallo-hydrolase, partial [Candidatus Thiodiazotropha sp. (ex Ustalcina ferruginea)]|nr:MBL fold metallo-hydrolase [Candidatus Thiodiazotropha sp. (ex Ustalcina ferruginea)]